MATTYMKLPYEDRVLRPDALQPLRLSSGIVGFTLDVRLNYYRGLPLSAIENLELSVDGVRVLDHLVLAGLREKSSPLPRADSPARRELRRQHRDRSARPLPLQRR